MPTLKAIHICNSHQPTLQPKIAKEYVFANADRRPKKTTKAQHCIKAIAGEVVKSGSVHSIHFCGGRQVIALKFATALILDRSLYYLVLKPQLLFSHY